MVIIVVIAVSVIWYKTPKDQKMWRFAYALLVAGALGNCLDRLRLGYVVDFLRLPHWPVFNIADCLLVLSVIILCLLVFSDLLKERKASEKSHD